MQISSNGTTLGVMLLEQIRRYIFLKRDSFFLHLNYFPTDVTKQGLTNYTGWKRNSLTPRTTIFPCPGCEHNVDLGERGINGLFRNFTLETIVERYRQAARAATAIMCDLCKPPPQESTKSCMDCSASYCNECFKIYHPWGTVKAQHEYVGPTTNFRPKVSQNSILNVIKEVIMNLELDRKKVTLKVGIIEESKTSSSYLELFSMGLKISSLECK